jgi:hypothetical protein
VKRGPGDALQRDVVAEEESVAKGLIVGELLRTREYPPERERRILDELEVFQKGEKASTYHIPMRRVGRFAFWEEGEPLISRTGRNQLPHCEDQVDERREESHERPRMRDERISTVEGFLSNRD